MCMETLQYFLVLETFCFQVLFREDSGTLRIERWLYFAPSLLFIYIIIQSNICFFMLHISLGFTKSDISHFFWMMHFLMLFGLLHHFRINMFQTNFFAHKSKPEGQSRL